MLTQFVLCLSLLGQVSDVDPVAQYRNAAVERWEKDIQAFEELDKKEIDPEHAILFVGSSSIRRWETIADDMQPWPTIRRGYGGAKLSDFAVFAERIVNPHRFDALAIFVGNDITGKDDDKSPEEVLRLFKVIVSAVRTKHPSQPIFFIAVTPTSSRFRVWKQVEIAHEMIRQHVDSDPSLHFIETADRFLGTDGKPMDNLFVGDKLHLNADGYKVWAKVISENLEKVLGKPKS